MNVSQRMAANLEVINAIRQIALQTVLAVTRNTIEDITVNDSAAELDNRVKLAGSIVKYDLTKRFGS